MLWTSVWRFWLVATANRLCCENESWPELSLSSASSWWTIWDVDLCVFVSAGLPGLHHRLRCPTCETRAGQHAVLQHRGHLWVQQVGPPLPHTSRCWSTSWWMCTLVASISENITATKWQQRMKGFNPDYRSNDVPVIIDQRQVLSVSADLQSSGSSFQISGA